MLTRYRSRSTFVFILAFTAIGFMYTGLGFADALSVSPPLETQLHTGSEVTLPISIKGAQDLGAFQFEMVFDEEILEIVDVTRGSGMPPVLLDFNVVRPGLLRVAIAGTEPIDGETRIDMRIRGLATGSSAIELQDVQGWALNTGYELLTEASPGQVTVIAGTPISGIWIAAIVVLILIASLVVLLSMRKSNSGRSNTFNVPEP